MTCSQFMNLLSETAFHNAWALKNDPFLMVEAMEGPAAFENRWLFSQIGSLKGKRVLDVGAGFGEASVWMALRGAEVTMLDVSDGMLQRARQEAEKRGVCVQTVQGQAEAMPFPEGTFDVVYGANVLHHCELDTVAGEVARILKPGGKAAFIEPLAHNPVINVYRRMAAPFRTPGEQPLRLCDLAVFHRFFAHVERRFFWLTALAIFIWFWLGEGVHPARERYWRKILVDSWRLKRVLQILGAVDAVLLRVLPPLGALCWNVALLCEKSGP